MNMKDMIQRMTDLENQGKKPLNESRRIAECPPEMAQTSMTPQASEGTPVSVNVNMTAAGKEHVDDLLSMMKAAGLDQAEPMKPDMMPMRTDMERLRGIVDDPEIPGIDDVPGDQDVNNGAFLAPMAGAALGTMAANKITGEEEIEEYENEPDYEYSDHEKMTHDLSGGINRPKNSYADAEDGDNAMAVEADDDDELSKKLFPKFKPGELDKMSRDKNRKMNQKRFMKPGKPKRSGEWSTYESDSEDEMKEAIRSSLMKALAEKKSKPDYIDLDKDGDKKEPMKKAAKDKKKKKKTNETELKDFKPKAVPGLYNFNHFEAPDGSFIQLSPYGRGVYQDADGNMHNFNSIDQLKQMFNKATEAELDEISSDLAKRYTNLAKMDRDFNDDDIDRLVLKHRYGSDADSKQAGKDIRKLGRRNSKRQSGLNRAKKRM